jgi:hypothetical protein
MESSRLSFKLFIENPTGFKLEDVVPVFHSWIQTHAISDHLLIDVADYAHVHDGPGIVLVSLEANYSLDTRGGQMGLTYQRKQPIAGDLAQRLRSALRATVEAAALLEASFEGKLKFRTDQIEFRICDRLAAPNNPETFSQVRPALEAAFPGAAMEYQPSELELFRVIVRPTSAQSLVTLLEQSAVAAS